jgi:hypothetical protein
VRNDRFPPLILYSLNILFFEPGKHKNLISREETITKPNYVSFTLAHMKIITEEYLLTGLNVQIVVSDMVFLCQHPCLSHVPYVLTYLLHGAESFLRS